MASYTIVVALVACVMAASVQPSQALPPQGMVGGAANSWIINAPWMPQWVPCDYTVQVGASCQDCSSKLICTQVGGLVKACSDPTLPHCNLGECSATPSAECTPADVPAIQAVPATA